MIYLDFSKKLQVIHIPKNGDYTGKIEDKPTFDEGYDKGYQDGLEDCECPECPPCKVEDYNIIINSNIEEHYASDYDLDGFSKVRVVAIPYGENRYKQGYDKGYEQGKSECPECNVGFKYHIVKDDIETINAYEFGYDGFNEVEIDASEFGNRKYEEGYEQGKSEGGEGGSCNIGRLVGETVVSDEGYIVKYAVDYGVDGWDYLELDVNQYGNKKYNQGYEQGKSEGGEGGNCNLGDLNVEWQSNWNANNFYAEREGLDGYRWVHINAENALTQKYEKGKNEVVQNLKPITITSNGTYTPEKSFYMIMDSDDCFPLGTFGNRIAFELKIDIKEKSNERKYILGNWVNDAFQGIWCDYNIGFDWGAYYDVYGGMPTGITTLKWWSDDDGNYSFIINDGSYSMATDGVDFSSIDLLLGALNNTCANMDFYSLKIWNDSSSYLNEKEPDYVYTVGEVENAIYKNNEVVSNIGDGAYAFKVEYQGSFGFNEVVVEINELNKSSKVMEFEIVGLSSPNINDKSAFKDVEYRETNKFILLFDDCCTGELFTYDSNTNYCLSVIMKDAFKDYNQFKSINFQRITVIGSQAFQDSVNLESIKLFGVGRIGEKAFRNCTSLKEIIFTYDTKPLVEDYAFHNVSETGTLYVPNDNEYWMNFKNNYLPAGWVTKIISE